MKMSTKESVSFVLEMKGITKYRLAQQMGSTPSSVQQWLKGTSMGQENKKIFLDLYKVEIDDSLRVPSKASR